MNIAPSVIATMSTVVSTDARTIFMRLKRLGKAAGRRIAQLNENQNAARSVEQGFRGAAQTVRSSAQAGPIVGDEDGIARIRRIVLHAGGLARDEPLETDLPFQTCNILRGVIGDSGNRVTVRDKVSGSQINDRTRAGTEEFSLGLARLGRM